MSGTQERDNTADRFEHVPIEQLHPSPFQTRTEFPDHDIRELAASIASVGIINPIVVRTNKDGLEIVAGERRHRAAKRAGLKVVPVVVRDLTDAQAMEVQIIENLQRKDIHPLDEAEGFRRLHTLDPDKFTFLEIAQTVGKNNAKHKPDASYVQQRMKLADLDLKAKRAFREGTITVGVATLLAPLAAATQLEYLAKIASMPEHWSYDALRRDLEASGVQDLARAIWKLDDATLYPDAGSCEACPKRTGNQGHLFPEGVKIGENGCLDATCFAEKGRRSFVATVLRVTEQNGGVEPVRVSLRYDAAVKGEFSHAQWSTATKHTPNAQLAIVSSVYGTADESQAIGDTLYVTIKTGKGKKAAAPGETDKSAKRAARDESVIHRAGMVYAVDRVAEKAASIAPAKLIAILAAAVFDGFNLFGDKAGKIFTAVGLKGIKLDNPLTQFDRLVETLRDVPAAKLSAIVVRLVTAQEAKSDRGATPLLEAFADAGKVDLKGLIREGGHAVKRALDGKRKDAEKKVAAREQRAAARDTRAKAKAEKTAVKTKKAKPVKAAKSAKATAPAGRLSKSHMARKSAAGSRKAKR